MLPSQYTSTYNHAYRDNASMVSPNAGQPMYHFPGQYDPSHYQRSAGYYGTRAVMAENFRNNANNQTQNNNVNYNNSQSYEPAPQQYNGTYNGQTVYNNTNRGPSVPAPSDARAFRSTGFQTTRYPTAQNLPVSTGAPAQKDLWQTPVAPHSGSFSNYTTIETGSTVRGYDTTVGHPAPSNGNGYGNNYNNTNNSGSSADYRYDPNGVAQTKNVDLTRNTDPRNKYMIPGYAGYIRGINFTHGDTYAKTTRTCLDAAIDQPREGTIF